MALLKRLTGVYERGALAALFGGELREQLAGKDWIDGDAGNILAVSAASILLADSQEIGEEAAISLIDTLRRSTRRFDTPRYATLRGLTAMVLGDDEVWAEEAAAAVDVSYAPGLTFGGNVMGLITYLGLAQKAGASFEDVEPALRNFIATYPSLEKAGFVDHDTLVLVGLVCGSVIGGMPLEDTLDWFGTYLCEGFGLER